MPEFVSILTQINQFIQSIFPALPINLLDVVIAIVIIYYAVEGYSLGFVLAACDLFSSSFY